MAKRLHMTNADYLAIAISPALIMALVGSLVFFLIEVFYAGQYQARLNYAFALFVFATVLIARISIEMGSERAALFALPLAIAMFLFLVKFVEHPSPFSHVINLALMTVVWWCAHKLTWDSTVIDDDEDASGEGLMQRIGVDGPEPAPETGTKDNELFDEQSPAGSQKFAWFKKLFRTRKGPHTPGVWVFYFSLAALPMFGIGQHWIPAADVGRRRYAFILLLVYVAAALSLLVSTSFLNLRRYLRQRHVEMPLPIAGTWVGVGAVLILIVMMAAMLIPRPGAEVAISRVPWQAGSPSGLTASRTSVIRDGGEQQGDQQDAQGGEKAAEEGKGDLPADGKESDNKGDAADENSKSKKTSDSGKGGSAKGEKGKGQDDTKDAGASKSDKRDAKKSTGKTQDSGKSDNQKKSSQNTSDGNQRQQNDASGKQNERKDESREQSKANQTPARPHSSNPLNTIQNLTSSLGGLGGLLKILFYIFAALLIAYFAWKYRHQLMQALSDILRALRDLFGGGAKAGGKEEADKAAAAARPRSFTDFRDPFLSGQHSQMPPEELVRYTFAAFEAWANDRGRPRTPDCTPQELVRSAVEPETPLYDEARQLVRMYSEVAYASRRVPRETAHKLRELWQLMRNTHSTEMAGSA
jgi:uncharacterized protein DUF4129